MIGKDSAVMNIPLDEVDYAAKLIRITPRLHTGTGVNDSMFHNSIKKALGKDISTGPHGKHKADRNDKKLMDTCIEMESLLVAKMLKEMRHTVHKTGWINGGFAEEIFEDMLYDEYALSLSKNSNLGLSKMLYNELKHRV